MKKILSILIVLTLIVVLASCDSGNKVTTDEATTTVTTTTEEKPIDPPAVDHEHSYTAVVTDPTCTEQGYTTYSCGCGESYADDYVDALDHSFGEWVTVKEATTAEEGLQERSCECGEKETQAINIRESEGLKFELNSDGNSYKLVKIGDCTDTIINIPSTYNGLPVTSIEYYAFRGCSSITSIVIPNSVTTIGIRAFESCYKLESIHISASVSRIDISAFISCNSLTNIIVDENNEHFKSIDGNLYSKDGKVLKLYTKGKKDTSFVIPNFVEEIGSSAFNACERLVSITIPNSVTKIGSYAFSDCRSLTNLTIPNSVTSIGSYAFQDCRKLIGITIPDSVKSISDYAFDRCHSLESIEVDKNNQYYQSIDGNLYSKDGTKLIRYASAKKDTEFTIPSTVTTIYDQAFAYCDLTSITIPNSVVRIGKEAFYYCTNLANLTIPESVAYIGPGAFYYCSELDSIDYGGTMDQWKEVKTNNSVYQVVYCSNGQFDKKGNENYSFGYYYTNDVYGLVISKIEIYQNVNLNVKIPNSINGTTVKGIGYEAFYDCDLITSVKIGDYVTKIGLYSFSCCDNLTSVTITRSVRIIQSGAFSYCPSLTTINYEGTVAEWDAITKERHWKYEDDECTIYCTDGQIASDGTVTYK